jgi:hypothetical protein
MTKSASFWATRGLLAGGALLASGLCAHAWPKDREVRYVLGSQASSVVELDARWMEEATGESVRDASFRYGLGRAPRVVRHEPTLVNGRYSVAMTVVTDDGAGGRRSTDVLEHVELAGDGDSGRLSFDLASRLARADAPVPAAGGTEP